MSRRGRKRDLPRYPHLTYPPTVGGRGAGKTPVSLILCPRLEVPSAHGATQRYIACREITPPDCYTVESAVVSFLLGRPDPPGTMFSLMVFGGFRGRSSPQIRCGFILLDHEPCFLQWLPMVFGKPSFRCLQYCLGSGQLKTMIYNGFEGA